MSFQRLACTLERVMVIRVRNRRQWIAGRKRVLYGLIERGLADTAFFFEGVPVFQGLLFDIRCSAHA